MQVSKRATRIDLHESVKRPQSWGRPLMACRSDVYSHRELADTPKNLGRKRKRLFRLAASYLDGWKLLGRLVQCKRP
jgi:hypothetical protein